MQKLKKRLTFQELSWVYETMGSLVDLMDERAVAEITSGTEKDLGKILNTIEDEAIQLLSGMPEPITSNKFYELDHLSKNIDESLKCLNYNYFKLTMLPDFYLAPHSIEWGNLVQLYQFLIILAARSLGKSFEMSMAYPIWKMYGYRRGTDQNPTDRKTDLRKVGALITNKYKLGKDLIKKISDEIKTNELLWDRLKPDSGGLGKEELECKNGAMLILRSYDSSIRGSHPGYGIVDDFLDKGCIYSQEQRDKFLDVFDAEIIPAIEPGGNVVVIGCVNPNSIVLTKNGLRRMFEISPLGETKREKLLVNHIQEIANSKGFDETSHFWYNGLTDTKKITLKYGIQLEGSLIHPVKKMDKNGIPDWCQLQDLQIGDYIAVKIGNGFAEASSISLKEFKENLSIKNKKPIDIPDFVNEELAYLIGLWVADGSFENNGRVVITKMNPGIQDRVLNNKLGIDFKIHQEFRMRTNSKILLDLFRFLEVPLSTAIGKDIPTKILHSNKETIIWFLRGLFDGDGSCYVDKKKGVNVTLGSISESLIRNVQQVLIQIGIVGSILKRLPAISDRVKGIHPLYVLSINGLDARKFIEEIGFPSSGKMDKVTDISREMETNCCYIPYQKDIIKGVRIEKPRRERGLVSILPPFRSQEVLDENIRLDKLKLVYNWFVENGANGLFTDQLKSNIEDDLVYLPIKEIEDSSCYTVDFHIPKSHEFITNSIISHNTPFHEADLYTIKRKDKKWKTFEYPAIFPDGRLAAPHRYNLESVMGLRQSLGSLIFSREILVVPISDSSTIFPWSILEKSFVGMQNYVLVDNIDSFPMKFKFVKMGCDFAISANIGSDSTVFTVWGCDVNDRWWLLHIWVGNGKSHNEQIAKVVELERKFRPNEIIMETNGFQQLMAEIAKEHGVRNIVEFKTNGFNKKDVYDGLPGLAVLFENGQILLPRGDEYSRKMTDYMCSEFNSITIKPDSGKLESAGAHDDSCMSAFFGIKGGTQGTKKQEFTFSMM